MRAPTIFPRAVPGLSLAAALFAAAPLAWSAPKPPPPPPLDGTTVDYAYDGRDIGHPERAWLGRAFVHRLAATEPARPRPLLVFIHGLNRETIKYRWMGGGSEGDVRRIVAGLIEAGKVEPLLVAAPSSTVIEAVSNAGTSWPAFDLDRFLDETRGALGDAAAIDTSRIIVAAHSGGGCNAKGGIATAVRAKTAVHAALVIDTCMFPDLADVLTAARRDMHVVVSWQTLSWDNRPFDIFRARVLEGARQSPPQPGFLRELEHVRPREPMPHDAMVGITLGAWLPRLLAPSAPTPSPSSTPSSTPSPSPLPSPLPPAPAP
jgi:hypothetical protein